MHRRIVWLWVCIATTFAVLTGRLFVLAAFPDGLVHPALRWQDQTQTRAQLEHMRGVVTDDARGRILFRNGLPITGTIASGVLVAGGSKVPYAQHSELTRELPTQAPFAGSAVAVAGVVGEPDVWPTPARVVAEQGRSGLEARFERMLRGTRPGYLGVLTAAAKPRLKDSLVASSDATRKIARSFGPHDLAIFRVAPVAGADVWTTLDAAWQAVADKALAAHPVRAGAVVVLDVATNQVLAMANQSTDRTNPLPAIHSATPGSVFKLVTAAAAYESYRFSPDAHFVCDGVSRLAGVKMRCWRNHGKETLTAALAQSCDIALAQVGVAVGRQGLTTAWNRLHLNDTQLQSVDGRTVLAEAQAGQLFRRPGADNGLLANTAIGQEDVRVTPLQAANLARTVATGGMYNDVQLVLGAKRPGKRGRIMRVGHASRAFSGLTAVSLSQGMRRAVYDPRGTAHPLAFLGATLAAKTGTAELADGHVNAWLVGYAPFDHPQIAFCVFVGDTPSATGHAAVQQITRALLQADRQFPPPEIIG